MLSFPTLSFFIVDKSEPCICMPVDTHHTHYRGQLEPLSPILDEDQDHLCSLGTSCYPRTAHRQVAGSRLPAILFSSPQDMDTHNREEEKYPSQLTLSGSSSTRNSSLRRLRASMNIWSQEKRGGHSLSTGKIVPGTNPEFAFCPSTHGSLCPGYKQDVAPSELLCKPFPQNAQGPPWR